MTPKNMPPPNAAGSMPALRPPDFFLPKGDRAGTRRRSRGPEIYVAYGGQIYGPAEPGDVMAGVRSSFFEEGAVFWFEGMDEWKALAKLPELLDAEPVALPTTAVRHTPPSEGIRPSWPGPSDSNSSRPDSSRSESSRSGSSGRRRRRRKSNRKKPSSRSGDGSNMTGRLVVIGAVLLAVLITAGLLLLISLV